MSKPKKHFVDWLRDAHAMEEQAATMLRAQANRLEHYPMLKKRIEQHLEETERQADTVEAILERLGSGTSGTKDMTAKLSALMQGVGGMLTGDEVVKGALASYAFEHMEIASYRILIAAANELGDGEAASALEGILQEEVAMADWLRDNLDHVTTTYLKREAAGATAKV